MTRYRFHVSPDGDDSAEGGPDTPFATLERALHAARTAPGGATVRLRAGTHVLTEPLVLTEEDSGTAFRAHGDGPAVISGGRPVTGWRESGGVWTAEVGALDFRELYVDGRRAERAAVDALPEGTVRTETGYATPSTAPLAWRGPASVEFVYRGVYPWTEARCPVAAVDREGDTTVITMAQPGFAQAGDVYNYAYDGYTGSGLELPTRVENDPAFLTEPGTFALDRSRPGRHVLHYLPRPGEDPATTRAVAPALPVLLRVEGARDLAFEGLVLADATWPRAGAFLHYHGTGYYDGEGAIEKVPITEGGSWVTVPARTKAIPACVVLDGATGVRFDGCRFTRLGATALAATGGADLTVRGCDFDTISAAGVTLAGTRGALLEDNLVHRTGLDYPGAPGISIGDTTDCTVTRNHVDDVPHCGICAYTGRGTRIIGNRVTNSMGALADGGGIYVAGPQGDSWQTGAVVSGNVVADTRTPYNFGLYTDYGAAWVRCEENVVTRSDNTAVLTVAPPLDHVAYRGNVWDAEPVSADAVPDGVDYAGNLLLAGGDPSAAAAAERISANAGLLRERRPAA
ncbi:right-handed parallel beta-helix repeat-containing protein [Streptomonospora nanhaiensis]|uniref:right-handed parallel beta-helix repeat-containing protein n=1 Tax=Streptomonospora nanhaiensis TaxID=1323731 RepID=UPI001C38AB83|nr:right-handed parallel beta-helix repeat-containing protein [Streptomonospora nanhaiensis]MBV2365452.1 right-handed parallel beta-helix repeat-containing protein [Streptomonospora nanhaiensis]